MDYRCLNKIVNENVDQTLEHDYNSENIWKPGVNTGSCRVDSYQTGMSIFGFFKKIVHCFKTNPEMSASSYL